MFSALLIVAGIVVIVLKLMEAGPFEKEPKVKVEVKKVIDRPPPIFIEMDPLTITLFKGENIAGILQIAITLEVIGKKNAREVNRLMTKIRDIFIRDMHSFIPRLIKQEERIDVLILKQRLQLMSNRHVARGLIESVLVQSVIETPSN